MNRQNRRHPTHPLLPILESSKKRIPDEKSKKTNTTPKKNSKIRKIKV